MHAHDRQYAWKYEYASRSRITMFLTGQAVTQAHVSHHGCVCVPSASAHQFVIFTQARYPHRMPNSTSSRELRFSIECLPPSLLCPPCCTRTDAQRAHITGAGGCAPASHFLPKPFLPPAAIFGGDGGSTNAGSSSEPDSASEDGAAFPPVTELPAAGLGEPMKR